MGNYFLDTSALVKRHVLESGHLWVRALCRVNAGNTIIISEAALIEVVASVCRMARENPPRLAIADRDRIIARFQRLIRRNYLIVQVNRETYIRAAALCRKHPLRAYDAVQLACALAWRDDALAISQPAPIFVCADHALLGAAALEGFAIENPSLHA